MYVQRTARAPASYYVESEIVYKHFEKNMASYKKLLDCALWHSIFILPDQEVVKLSSETELTPLHRALI